MSIRDCAIRDLPIRDRAQILEAICSNSAYENGFSFSRNCISEHIWFLYVSFYCDLRFVSFVVIM